MANISIIGCLLNTILAIQTAMIFMALTFMATVCMAGVEMILFTAA